MMARTIVTHAFLLADSLMPSIQFMARPSKKRYDGQCEAVDVDILADEALGGFSLDLLGHAVVNHRPVLVRDFFQARVAALIDYDLQHHLVLPPLPLEDVVVHLLGVGNDVFLACKERIILAFSRLRSQMAKMRSSLLLKYRYSVPLLRPNLLAM